MFEKVCNPSELATLSQKVKSLSDHNPGLFYNAVQSLEASRDDTKLFLHQASADEKISAPRDAGSNQNVRIEDMDQRTIESENNSNQLPTHITEPPPIYGRGYFLPPLTSLLKKKWARAASCKSIFSLVASSNDINTGGRIGMDRAQESEVLMGRDPGGSIRHSAQNSDITRKER
jgi:hypothetical protein